MKIRYHTMIVLLLLLPLQAAVAQESFDLSWNLGAETHLDTTTDSSHELIIHGYMFDVHRALVWNSIDAELNLYRQIGQNEWTLDPNFVWYEGEGGLPSFTVFDAYGEVQFEGFVAPEGGGKILVQFDEGDGVNAKRYYTIGGEQMPMQAKECVCYGVKNGNETDCTDSNCDWMESCDSSGAGKLHCKWVYKSSFGNNHLIP